jgi:hypothetical protein
MTPEDVLTPTGFLTAFETTISKGIKVWPARSWSPTLLSNPCDLHVVRRFNRWEEQMPHDAHLQAIFGEGHIHQPAVYTQLEAMGFTLIRESDRPTQWKPRPGVTISGYIDGRLTGFKGQKFTPTVLVEIKALSGWSWDKLNTVEDFLTNDAHYIRGYVQQMDMYLLLEELPLGVFILKNKANAWLKLIPVPLDMARAEVTLKPPGINYDARICGGCGFRYICWPPREEAGVDVIMDAELVEAIKEKEALSESHSEYEAADRRLKKAMEPLLTKDEASVLIDGGEAGRDLATLKIIPMKEQVRAATTQRRITYQLLDKK